MSQFSDKKFGNERNWILKLKIGVANTKQIDVYQDIFCIW